MTRSRADAEVRILVYYPIGRLDYTCWALLGNSISGELRSMYARADEVCSTASCRGSPRQRLDQAQYTRSPPQVAVVARVAQHITAILILTSQSDRYGHGHTLLNRSIWTLHLFARRIMMRLGTGHLRLVVALSRVTPAILGPNCNV